MQFDHYLIRELREDDLLAYFTLIDSNRKRLEDFFAGTVAQTGTLEDTRMHVADVMLKRSQRNHFLFLVEDSSNSRLIASIQIKNLDWSIPKAEMGYYIDEPYEGKGVVTKATSLIIDYGFRELGMSKLFIRTHEENISSRKVAEKNRFRHEGTIRRDYKTTAGRVVDLMYYGLLQEEWLQGEPGQTRDVSGASEHN